METEKNETEKWKMEMLISVINRKDCHKDIFGYTHERWATRNVMTQEHWKRRPQSYQRMNQMGH